MLTSILSAVVAPEGNLRISWHAGDEARKWGVHPGFETQGRRHQKSKTGVSNILEKTKKTVGSDGPKNSVSQWGVQTPLSLLHPVQVS